MSEPQEIAEQILAAAGGSNNIIKAAFCMTRVRLTLIEPQKADREALASIKGILGLVESGGQLQLVVGPGKPKAINDVINKLIKPKIGQHQAVKAALTSEHRAPIKALLRKLAHIFIPLIPAIVASGMIAGLTNVALKVGADPQGAFISIMDVTGWGLFAYLSVFVGIYAAKEFGGTPAMGGLAGVMLINPAISNIHLDGLALVPGRGGIFGVLLVAWFICAVEKRLRKIVPTTLDAIVTPVLTLLVASFATYYVLQPIGGIVSDSITSFFQIVLQQGGAVAGFILSGVFLPLVMTGLHQGLVPVQMEMINSMRENPLLPIIAMAGTGQVGASFAVYLRTKNSKLKEVVKGALPVGILGIGEPLIFGVTLPLGRPFIAACAGGAIGGAFQAAMHVSSVAMGVSGLPLVFLILPGQVFYYLTGVLISYVAGFLIAWIIGFDDPVDEEVTEGQGV